MRLAVIKDAVVVNVVAVDDHTRADTIAYLAKLGCVCIDSDDASLGDAWIAGQLVPKVVAPALDLDILADKTVVAVGETINIAARLLVHGTSIVAPIDQGFAVPVEDAKGSVAMIKGVRFAQGIASVTLIFTKSGYYRITEAGINHKLPDGQRIGFSRWLEVTVYE